MRMGFKCKITGLDELKRQMDPMEARARVVNKVKINGARLEAAMKRKAQFKGHMEPFRMSRKGGKLHPIPVGELRFVNASGILRGSVVSSFSQGGLTVSVYPQVEYAPYVEYGTRFMKAQPFVKPAYEAVVNQFLNDMKDVMK
ncbi:HK97-gp10 family putative phage morphogenesis protein [Ileibacterium valens]|uniref:HK97-gp10 family putative phage morphogenesis protein n=1 Tax=Ileibacterium valens TaxID=1862668 RepID=UPI0024B8796C|nr:HK97-gp10 family putative phage morphogenesis protein [Ileibacterium valens]